MIAMIEERRYLWDVKEPRYHRRDLKEKTYGDIAAALGPKFSGMYKIDNPECIYTDLHRARIF